MLSTDIPKLSSDSEAIKCKETIPLKAQGSYFETWDRKDPW